MRASRSRDGADFSYSTPAHSTGSQSLKWSVIGLVGRQGVVSVVAIALARLLGPEAYGVVAQATIYITLTTLLLDQGVAAALTSMGELSRRAVGAAASLNIFLAVVLGGATYGLAPAVSSFFSEPSLVPILRVLGIGLVLKAIAIVPRMLLARVLNFRAIALSDCAGALLGGVVAIALALRYESYWALIAQTVGMDLVVALLLVWRARPPVPNLAVSEVPRILAFGGRVFASNALAFAASNSDSTLIGRSFGPSALAPYSLAYQVLKLPVLMTGQMISRVLLPIVARRRHLGMQLDDLVGRAIRGVSAITFPLMTLFAVSAPLLVPTVLGPGWSDAIPLIAIFALSGARQSITTLNTPILFGLGHAGKQLRFSVVAATTQVCAIVIGLNWGVVGVAVGYTTAGFLLGPLSAYYLRSLAGLSYVDQFKSVAAAGHSCAWMALAYFAVSMPLNVSDGARLALGVAAASTVYLLVMRFGHSSNWRIIYRDVMGAVKRTEKVVPPPGESSETPAADVRE